MYSSDLTSSNLHLEGNAEFGLFPENSIVVDSANNGSDNDHDGESEEKVNLTSSMSSTINVSTQQVERRKNAMQYSILLPHVLQSYVFEEELKSAKLQSETKITGVELVDYSPDGRCLLIVFKDRFQLYDTSSLQTHKLLLEIREPQVDKFQFSPNGRHFVTARPFSTTNKEDENISVWDTISGECSFKTGDKNLDPWPRFQWNQDCSRCLGHIEHSIHMFDKDMNFQSKLKANVEHFKLSPLNTFATYSVGKNKIAQLQLFKFGKSPAVCSQPTQAITTCKFFWNRFGTHCLAMTAAEHDSKKNVDSYYEKNSLYMMNINGSSRQLLEKETEQIYDAQWNPAKGTEFIVVHGYPPKATLYNDRLEIIGDLGTGTRNLVLWNPFGKLFCLAGLGNMNGALEIWDRQKLKKVGQRQLNRGSRIQWSPDGRVIMSSTVQQRLKIDNGFQLIKYNGLTVVEREYDQLFFVGWCPGKDYQFRSPSPKGLKQSKANEKKAEAVKKYVPPSMRNKA